MPVTDGGRIATIFYSLVGIPLTLLILADIGNMLGKIILIICKYLRPTMVITRIKNDNLCNCFTASSHQHVNGESSFKSAPYQPGDGHGKNKSGFGVSLRGFAQSANPDSMTLQTYDSDPSVISTIDGSLQQDKSFGTLSSPPSYNQSLSAQSQSSSSGIREDIYSPSPNKDSQDLYYKDQFSKAVSEGDHECEVVMNMSNEVVLEEVPVTVVVLIFVGYTLISALLIQQDEKGWSYLQSVYFTFITYTTIGFGDVLPTTHYEEGEFFACFMFSMFGLAVTSTCVTLVQAKVVRFCKKMATKLGFSQ